MTVANFESTSKPLPYSATVAESTTVIVYRTDLRRIRNDNDERAWTESHETLEPGTEFRYAEYQEGFYNAELHDGGRCLIGVDFVSDAIRPKQQHDDDDDNNTQHDEDDDDGRATGLDD